MSKKTAIEPSRGQDFSEWYLQVVKAAEMAEHSPVRGAMVIKPWGYGIWENMQKILDRMFKKTGVENAYFPLFIPLSFFVKEAEHVEGFAKECAIVTHHRLEKGEKGGLVPAGELEEPLVVRPTSEMIIGHSFSKWIQSYRDLPVLINQWANVVRWELRTRLFLRTSEFLWQEGHTAHASKKEANTRALMMLDVYTDFLQDYLAIPVIKGIKTKSEKFPGAEITYTVETMMQDRKALQAGTSHFLGQNFAKSCEIVFRTQDQKTEYVWTTSWGSTTRYIGALIMTHGDDDGLVLPPKIAPTHIAIIPIVHKEQVKKEVFTYCEKLCEELNNIFYSGAFLQAIVDTKEMRGGEKNWSWIKKGVPIRLEIGPRDIKEDAVMMMLRTNPREKVKILRKELISKVCEILDDMQQTLFKEAQKFRDDHTVEIENVEDFYKFFTPKNAKKPEIHGGFASCYFCEDSKTEEKLKKDLSVTARCILLDEKQTGQCIFTGKTGSKKMIFAKAY